VARAFGVPLLNVLVAAGHITPEEAGIPPEPMRVRRVEELSASEVIEELRRRVEVMEAELQRLHTAEAPERTGRVYGELPPVDPAKEPERSSGTE
jgi:hypothetical protein